MNEKISVIVPVYNAEAYLDKCIESLIRQSYDNLEIILIDDKSTDKSLKICYEWRERDERISVFEHSNNKGQASARNLGLEKASGKYITFVDSDDWIEEKLIEKLYNKLKEENADISCCGFRLVYEKGGAHNIQRKNLILSSEKAFGSMLANDGSIIGNEVWGKLFHSHIFKEYRFVENMLYEDAHMMLQVLQDDLKIVCIDTCLYNYYIRDNSTMRKVFDIHELDRLKVWQYALYLAEDRYKKFIRQAEIRKLRCELYLYYKLKKNKGIDPNKENICMLAQDIVKYNLNDIKTLANVKEKFLFLLIKFSHFNVKGSKK